MRPRHLRPKEEGRLLTKILDVLYPTTPEEALTLYKEDENTVFAAGGGGFCCLRCVILGRTSYDADDEAQSRGDGDDDGRLLSPLRAKHLESSPLDSCLPASHRSDYSNV